MDKLIPITQEAWQQLRATWNDANDTRLSDPETVGLRVVDGVVVPKELLRDLHSYGLIQSVEGVKYPSGTHADCLRQLGKLLSAAQEGEGHV